MTIYFQKASIGSRNPHIRIAYGQQSLRRLIPFFRRLMQKSYGQFRSILENVIEPVNILRADCAKWLEKAAEQGYAPAEMMYGLYMMGDACGLKKL